MRCLKLLGERIMSRDFDRQVAELQVRAALLNRFTQLGTPVIVAAINPSGLRGNLSFRIFEGVRNFV
jgi:hypothetical protein